MTFDFDQSPYVDLRGTIAEQANRVVAWTGAGLSTSAGVPSWAGLRTRLTDALVKKAATFYNDRAEQEKLRAYAENARRAKTHWDAFNILKLGLGETSYQAEIKRALALGQRADLPEAYIQLWRLPLAGMVTLNLDRMAARGFAHVYGGDRSAVEFSSKDVGEHTPTLANPFSKFIYNAHGTDNDVHSWVFTHDDLSNLLRNPAYVNFINSILTSTTVVFLGISADDIAAGGHLERLRGTGIRTAPHYWITDRTDAFTDAWAERCGIRVIRYPNEDGDHAQQRMILEDLCTFVAEDETVAALPVVPEVALSQEVLPGPDTLRREEPEMIRLFLNAHAQQLLLKESDEAYSAYRSFVDEYSLPIHIAWFVDTKDGANEVLGFRVISEAAKGAFGTVYKAEDRAGNPVALKVLREEIRNNHDALSSFRRGVGSMKILKQRQVKGMVEYLDGAEIPAMVVMEWIEGDNLRRAVASKKITKWDDILRVAVTLASILRDAHNLPERVLHRDLRPANVMLEGLYGQGPWQVKVLDFDLSWHRGAYENTLVHEAGSTGYLAPEQIHRTEGVSTRHSAVDAFGLGMTLYFMLTGSDPVPNQHRHANWEQDVYRAARTKGQVVWKSLPDRFARLILFATQDRQSDRPDITAMYLELLRLQKVLKGASPTTSADLLADELASRAESFLNYHWSNDQQAAILESPTALILTLKANESRGRIGFYLRKIDSGLENKKLMTRKAGPALAEARKLLNSGHWQVDTCQLENKSIHVVAYLRPEVLAAKLDSSATVIDKVVSVLTIN